MYPRMHWVGCVYPSMHWAGGVCRGGVCPGGVCPSAYWDRPLLWTESQTPVKIKPCHNYLADGKYWHNLQWGTILLFVNLFTSLFEKICNACYLLVPTMFSTETPCSFAARGPGTQTQLPINENTVLVFENVDLNICNGYNSTTGNVTLYCKNVDLNVSGGYDNSTGSPWHFYLFNKAVIGGNLAFGMGSWGANKSICSSGKGLGNGLGNALRMPQEMPQTWTWVLGF